MMKLRISLTMLMISVISLSFSGCKKEQQTPKPTTQPAETATSEKLKNEKPEETKAPAADSGDQTEPASEAKVPTPLPPPSAGDKFWPVTHLAGMVLTAPEHWDPKPLGFPGEPRANAVYRIANEGDNDNVAVVKVYHVPNMVDSEDMAQKNIDIWLSKITQPDGKPSKDVAKIETFDVDSFKVTLVDVTGTFMNKPDRRFIGTVIDYPEGPVFIRAYGPKQGVDFWEGEILEYIKGIKAPKE